jgi:hypothetical protein
MKVTIEEIFEMFGAKLPVPTFKTFDERSDVEAKDRRDGAIYACFKIAGYTAEEIAEVAEISPRLVSYVANNAEFWFEGVDELLRYMKEYLKETMSINQRSKIIARLEAASVARQKRIKINYNINVYGSENPPPPQSKPFSRKDSLKVIDPENYSLYLDLSRVMFGKSVEDLSDHELCTIFVKVGKMKN